MGKSKDMKDFFQRLFNSRYIGLLEADVARLRAENRALMNSLLGTAGFPPVEFPEVPKPQPLPRLRKRSWHQLQAWRETESTRGNTPSLEDSELSRRNGPVPQLWAQRLCCGGSRLTVNVLEARSSCTAFLSASALGLPPGST